MRAEFAKLVGNQNPKGGGLGNPTSRKGREKWGTRRRGVYPGLTSLRRAWAGSGLLSAAPPGLVPFSSGIPTACAVGCILSPLRGCGRDRSEGSQNPHRHASVPRIGMLRLRSRFVTRAGKPGSGEGQNTNGLRVVESHFSQRTREMGQPAAVVVRAEKQVPRLRVSVLRTITLRSG